MEHLQVEVQPEEAVDGKGRQHDDELVGLAETLSLVSMELEPEVEDKGDESADYVEHVKDVALNK